MTNMRLHVEGLKANVDDRTISGLMLPFNEVGRTNLGEIRAYKDTELTVAERVVLNMEHDGGRPVGSMVAHEVTDEGIVATFRVAKTTQGNDLLAEVDEGLRTGLSVEIQNPVVRKGTLISGLLDGCAAVTKPAFDSARVLAACEDLGEVEAEEQEEETPEDNQSEETVAEDEESEADTEEEDTVSETVTASLAASAASSAPKGIKTVNEFVTRMAAAAKTGDRALLAALSDITQTGVGGDVTAQQFLGELWSGKGYSRNVVPLVKPGTLTSYSVKGWRWVTKPEVAAYAGDKAAVTSNAPDTEAVTVAAARLAGAHDIDRKFFDFNDTEFLQSYLQAMTESYARKTDEILIDFLQSSATSVTPGVFPTGVGATAAALVDGALAVVDYGVPTFAVVSTGAYRSLLLTPKDQVLEFLSQALGLEEGTVAGFRIVPRADLLPGQVIVGVNSAVQFMELPGVPIRVDALNIANGGVDQGVFGYYAEILHSADGLAKVTLSASSISAGDDFSITVGDPDVALDVWATYADGSKINVGSDPACVLTSATPAKASIVSNKIHAVANGGSSVITATYQGKTDTVTVTVL